MIKWMRGENENIILEVECNSLSPHIPQFPLLFQYPIWTSANRYKTKTKTKVRNTENDTGIHQT